MSLHQHASVAYARPHTPARSARALEYDLLARVTQRLRDAWGNREKDFATFANALTENLQVWSTFAADVADKGNGLPAPLRAQLFYLFQFTTLHSRKVMDGSASVEVLIDINTAVMRGLRGDPGDQV